MPSKRKGNKPEEKNSWNSVLSMFRLFNRASPYCGYPVTEPRLKRPVDLEPEAKTLGHTLNRNATVSDSVQGVVLPVGMMKQADDHIVIHERKCPGCGFCAAHCPQEAVTENKTSVRSD